MTTGVPSSTHPARPRRSRLRTFLPLGVAAWLVLEIWLLTVVAGAADTLFSTDAGTPLDFERVASFMQ